MAGAPYGCGAVRRDTGLGKGRPRSGHPFPALTAKSAPGLGDYGLPHALIACTGALFAMKLNGRDRALKVTPTGTGLAGPAAADLLRKAADRLGPTPEL